MTIKTKFDIGDKVFTLGASNNGKPYVRHGIIDSIDLRVDETGRKCCYHFKFSDHSKHRIELAVDVTYEEYLFKTEEEVVNRYKLQII